MKSMLSILTACALCGCAAQGDRADPHAPSSQDAPSAVSELRVGMAEADVMGVLKKHGIEMSGAIGGTMAWSAMATLPDKWQLTLDFRYESRELRDKGPSKLTGWRMAPEKDEAP
jgi:hypothetical protein